jgi:hypothetical protein
MGEDEERMKINVVEYFTLFLSGFVAKLVFSTVPNLKLQPRQTAFSFSLRPCDAPSKPKTI